MAAPQHRRRGRHRRPEPPAPPGQTARRVLRAAAVGAAAVLTVTALTARPDVAAEVGGESPAATSIPTAAPTSATFAYPTPRPPVTPIPPPPETEVVPAETTAPSPPAAEPPPPPPPPPPLRSSCSTELQGTRPHVAQVGHFLAAKFGHPLAAIGGFRASARDPDGHPAGRALDFGPPITRDRGDAIAAYAVENRAELGVEYVIWRQRINNGDGWEPMGDRGDDTQNHFDHVHINFEATNPGLDLAC